jgi:hypothetical protein
MKLLKIPKIKTRNKIILSIVFIFGLFSFFPPVGAFFTAIFVVFLFFRIDPRILGIVAIALLVSIPLFQYYEMNERAEQMAVYVYFLLVIIVVLQILDSKKNNNQKSEGERHLSSTSQHIPNHRPSTKKRDLSYTIDNVTYTSKRKSYKQNDETLSIILPAYRRDMERELQTPLHRLSSQEVTGNDRSIPLHLSLPERLKLLSDKQRKNIHAVKPSLDDIKDTV